MQDPIKLQPASGKTLTFEEFLNFIADKEEEYEFIDGRAVALASPSKRHGRLVTVLTTLLQNHVRGSGYDVYGSQDLETAPSKKPRRPDLAVTCDERDKRDDDSDNPIHFPKLVIEVLSPKNGGELTDKLNEYEALPSIEEYIVVDSSRHWVRRYYRKDSQLVFNTDQISGAMGLSTIGYVLDIDALYTEARV